ncbi:MAG: DNA gyrase subunit A, partial [Clostridia bacterium]|nr:DNA gyrase subunit A [Clostridia bacterium]
LTEGEKVTTMLSTPGFAEDEYLLFVTKFGTIKRTAITEYEYQRRGGKIAIDLDEGDELVFVKRTKGESDIIIATHEGSANRFDEADARIMGRTARGVRGIKLDEGDYVVGAVVVEDGKYLLTVSEKGIGKRSRFDDIARRNRGGKGVTCQNLNERSGLLAGILSVGDDDDIMIITEEGTVIRTAASDIPIYSRTAAGVIVMRLEGDDSIVNITAVNRNEEDPTDAGKGEE